MRLATEQPGRRAPDTASAMTPHGLEVGALGDADGVDHAFAVAAQPEELDVERAVGDADGDGVAQGGSGACCVGDVCRPDVHMDDVAHRSVTKNSISSTAAVTGGRRQSAVTAADRVDPLQLDATMRHTRRNDRRLLAQRCATCLPDLVPVGAVASLPVHLVILCMATRAAKPVVMPAARLAV